MQTYNIHIDMYIYTAMKLLSIVSEGTIGRERVEEINAG
jgi:hypothetical protein